jgi:hypothetical protein
MKELKKEEEKQLQSGFYVLKCCVTSLVLIYCS